RLGTPDGATCAAADPTGAAGPAGEVPPCGVGTSGGAQKVSRTTIRLNPRGGPHSPVPLAVTGLSLSKTCPGPAPVPPGSSFQCTFSIGNQDPVNQVINLAVTNQVPCTGGVPGVCGAGSGPTVPVPCEFPPGTTAATLPP